jgi:ABC-type polysaccharide/polyol phosphate transport system ATPase subunit
MDNIILYGVLLGFSRQEMISRSPSILEFAELQDYALVPVKALSSGMVARLGFAIATDVQPDILILDEVLSVGDESFKNKCKKRIEKFWEADATVLVVSHDLGFIKQSCQYAIWLDKGKVELVGDAEKVVESYLKKTAIAQASITRI